MAVAGLHNLSAFGPFFGDSQSTVSRQWSDEAGTPRTRASSLLQMWRELEGDHVVSPSHRSRGRRIAPRSDNGHDISEDADDTETQAVTGSEIDHDDNNSIISEQSSDLGEVERERVRQIFQEWTNSGAMGRSPLNNRSGPQWLGENECERVRVIREWVQVNAQHRNNQASVRDGGADAGSHIEQVREGLTVAHHEAVARRPIRRLCGRQTLLDLLQRAQCERKEELQGLLEHRPVSDFTHRNRIQALLRGRFLRNERMVPDIRPSSVAATELGLLRQRHTVSGLREGFLSKLEKSASTSTNSAESDSWLSDQNHSELESTLQEREIAVNSATPDLESVADRNGSWQEFGTEVTEVENQVVHDSGNEENVSSGNEGHVQEVSSYIDVSRQDVPIDVVSVRTTEGQVLDREVSQATEQMSTAEEAGIIRHREEINVTVTNELSLETEDLNFRAPNENILHDHYESRSAVSYDEEAATHTVDLEGNMDEQFDRPVDSATDIEEWVDTSGESMARSWQETSGNELLRETSDNNAAEQDQMQESHDDWPSHDLQEAIDSWLGMPSGEVGASVGRLDAFYYSDDDNVHSIELRELFSRRRVSGLLRSGFRESLDQVLQSHVERQGHASGDWELENESSSPSLVGQDQGQPNGDRALDLSDAAERNSFAPTSSFVSAPQPLWDEEMQGASLPHFNLSQHFGTEWEVVNELRNDMARLQQRLNNMQSMLEQCMDMQIELQRSVRQEVSAALNRSFLTKGASKRIPFHDESQWDCVRKGVCCLCHDSNIDTLLYRCGHMCSCSKCADKLIQDTGKCPMCRAPVVEAVRAYFIQ
ncbi:uncharacterized protein LOC131020067 [Salvia miltiorrhiza]|uniref:uncharacterized protein LOC131020067 n=1 Tax=Salvia miltiorrhiza TaxID=226208 RepID=UPI0025AD3CE2|nr:uncharacterized protein LOC131020067 [Salvia miltiorrhiza]